jgi:hypothetical protein
MVFLSAFLNANTFVNSSIDSVGENNSIILSQIKGTIEYGLKYGKELHNYYGIEDILGKAAPNLDANYIYIRDIDGTLLYGDDPDRAFDEAIVDKPGEGAVILSEEEGVMWISNKRVHMVMPIYGISGDVGYIGTGSDYESMKKFSEPYVRQMYTFALI